MRMVVRLGARDGNFEDFRAFGAIRGAKRKSWIDVVRRLQSEDPAYIGLITKNLIKLSDSSIVITIYNSFIIGFSQFHVSDDGSCRTISVQRLVITNDPNDDGDDTPRPGGRRRTLSNAGEFNRVPYIFAAAALVWRKSTGGPCMSTNAICNRSIADIVTRRAGLESRSALSMADRIIAHGKGDIYYDSSQTSSRLSRGNCVKADLDPLDCAFAKISSIDWNKIMLIDYKNPDKLSKKACRMAIPMAPAVDKLASRHFTLGRLCESGANSVMSHAVSAMPWTHNGIQFDGRGGALTLVAFPIKGDIVDNQELRDLMQSNDRKLRAEYKSYDCGIPVFKVSTSTGPKFRERKAYENTIIECSNSVRSCLTLPEQPAASMLLMSGKVLNLHLDIKEIFIPEFMLTRH